MTWCLLLILFAGEEKEESVVPKAFDVCWMVLLKKGPTRNHSPEESALIQTGHLAHLKRLYNEGKILVAGPLEVDETHPIRGIVLYSGDLEQATVKHLAESDPAVKTGRLEVEIMKWWTPKDAISFNKTAY